MTGFLRTPADRAARHVAALVEPAAASIVVAVPPCSRGGADLDVDDCELIPAPVLAVRYLDSLVLAGEYLQVAVGAADQRGALCIEH